MKQHKAAIIVVFFIIVLASGLVYWATNIKSTNENNIESIHVTRGTIQNTISALGHMEPRVTNSAPYS